MIETEGKLAFCKLFLEDLKELKKKTWSSQDRKKMFTKEMKQYCFHRNSAKDRKFLASFDKLIRKEKKKMDKKYAKNNDYLKLNLDDNLYNRLNLNDTDFFMSVKGFLSTIQKNPVNDDDTNNDNADDDNNDNADNTVDNNDDDANVDNSDDSNDTNDTDHNHAEDAGDGNANVTGNNNADDADNDNANDARDENDDGDNEE